MSEKYIDLKPQIVSDYALVGATAVQGGVGIALEWIDRHPGQAPGRTVTRRDFERAFDFHFDDEDIGRHERFLAHLGITVVPDPEPTNAEKLHTIIDDGECPWPSGPWAIADFLDRHGVKAPGGYDA